MPVAARGADDERRLPAARQLAVVNTTPTWRILVGAPLAAALLAAAALLLAFVTPWPRWMALAAAAMTAYSALTAIGAVQHHRRQELIRVIEGQLLPVTGPVLVQVRRWSGGREPHPRKLRLTYSSGAPAGHSSFAATVCEVVSTVCGEHYELAGSNRRRSTLDLERRPPAPVEQIEVHPQQERAAAMLAKMLGPGTEITSSQIDPQTGELTRIEGRHQIPEKIAATGYQRRVQATFTRAMPGRWRARWDLHADTFVFEVRPPLADLVELPAIDPVDPDPLLSYASLWIPIGVDEDGEVVGWTPKRDPMFVIVGKTGTGKTVTARSMIMTLARAGWMIWIVDGKGIEFLGLRDWPNVQIVANEVMEQVAVIYRAHQVMEHRYEQVRSGRARLADFEPLFVFIDEWADFRANLLDWWAVNKGKGAPSKPPVLGLLGSLLRKGRSSRVHIGLGTQRPDQEYFGGDMRDNLGARVSLGRLSPQGAMMMWDSPSIGVALPRSKRGRATVVNEAGDPVEAQTYYAPDPFTTTSPHELQHLEQLRPATVTHRRLVILPPQAEEDDTPPGYDAYLRAEWGFASDHPELDPLADRPGARLDPTVAGSPLSILRLVDPGPAGQAEDPDPKPTRAPLRLVEQTETPSAPTAHLDSPARDAEPDLPDEDYAAPETVSAADVAPGWLLLEDPDTDHWVVVDDIGDDPTDETQLLISWRDDDDLDGVISLEHHEGILARRPIELLDPALED